MFHPMIDRRRLLSAGMAALGVRRLVKVAVAQELITPRTLTGVWRGYVEEGGYRLSGEVIFRLDGTYQRMHWLGSLQTWSSGPYQIAENWIHFEVDDYEPKYYQGVYQHPPPSETWIVDVFTDTHIEGRIGARATFVYDKGG